MRAGILVEFGVVACVKAFNVSPSTSMPVGGKSKDTVVLFLEKF